MFRLADDLRVYLHREPIDFRAGISSLAILVEQSIGLNPFERAVFAFCNRRRTWLLFFDRSGFVLVLKALTEDKFRWCGGRRRWCRSMPSNCTGCSTA
ncbi:IS66 family insertion sequence element accessory protein TnpB, partial [Rhizobium sp. SEMIA 4085]|uniref:IS66 family insertion sequence element accessory protein TnpB n=1 Tax=Rhizobium sp. SEMIA 4085 TaxID=2137761 RepID=UPI00147918B1